MASRRELIARNRRAALEAASGAVGAVVHRYRIRPVERDLLPAWLLYFSNPPLGGQVETVDRMDHDPAVERSMNLRVEIRVSDEEPDAALDDHYVAVVKAMRADPTCGGLALDCQETAVSFDAADMGRPVGACAVDFTITYQTDEDDPEQGAAA